MLDSGNDRGHNILTLSYNAELTNKTPVYAKPPRGYVPKGFEVPEGKCWKLKKSLYGLKQSGFEWYTHFTKILLDMKMKQCHDEKAMFHYETKKGTKSIVALYVDDVLIAASNEKMIQKFVSLLEDKFDLKYFGEVSEYLGTTFKKTEQGYEIHQEKYVNDVVQRFKLDEITHDKRIPWIPKEYSRDKVVKSTDKENDFQKVEPPEPLSETEKKAFMKGVGTLNWLVLNTRADLSYPVEDFEKAIQANWGAIKEHRRQLTAAEEARIADELTEALHKEPPDPVEDLQQELNKNHGLIRQARIKAVADEEARIAEALLTNSNDEGDIISELDKELAEIRGEETHIIKHVDTDSKPESKATHYK
ncbi:uncharacterized protein J8A68_000563 [[Candida] subhashii]|uniref:Reverse transcriptase Ty1/copia-type domain-containing protein n=1 Tax=[Candida] subhashii TaxID=561895 RepID=A0A8J5QVM8_9ASCO|nr:uncharacterized protein J8A68_000563 [[Candida] subhashii]KAG7665940.1 hypothetical protein J8A68_000563 [[Candida] subhashii]